MNAKQRVIAIDVFMTSVAILAMVLMASSPGTFSNFGLSEMVILGVSLACVVMCVRSIVKISRIPALPAKP